MDDYNILREDNPHLSPYVVSYPWATEVDLIFTDVHVPFHDTAALELMYAVASIVRPTRIINLGDFIDYYSISKFNKDPARILRLQDDIDEAQDILEKQREIMGDIPYVYIEGNHEQRLQKKLRSNPELWPFSSLRYLNTENLLDLPRYNIDYTKEMYYIEDNRIELHDRITHTGTSIIAKHGTKVSKNGGYTAKRELEDLKVIGSGFSGHTHRLARISHSLGKQHKASWQECGCMCKLECIAKEYIQDLENWQNAFIVLERMPGKGLSKINEVEITIDRHGKYSCILEGSLLVYDPNLKIEEVNNG